MPDTTVVGQVSDVGLAPKKFSIRIKLFGQVTKTNARSAKGKRQWQENS